MISIASLRKSQLSLTIHKAYSSTIMIFEHIYMLPYIL